MLKFLQARTTVANRYDLRALEDDHLVVGKHEGVALEALPLLRLTNVPTVSFGNATKADGTLPSADRPVRRPTGADNQTKAEETYEPQEGRQVNVHA
tara:strand:- start:1365 stop:1655 length:291 start_codon:yes stop_codon:yes gene_type:complete